MRPIFRLRIFLQTKGVLQLWVLAEWVGAICLARWLVGGSLWLDFFLGSAVAGVAELHQRQQWNQYLFKTADAELVDVSALAHELEKRVSDLRMQLEEAQGRVEALEARP